MTTTLHTMNITPYGIDTCCICDAATTGLHRTTPADTLYPFCDEDRPAGGQWFAMGAAPDEQVVVFAKDTRS
jgi:hypothetical protein